MHEFRLGNLLGAAALAISDRMLGAVTARVDGGPSAAAALVVLLEVGPMGVSRLGRCIGLTQSATTRAVDALERQGLTRRTPAGRERVIELTPSGRKLAQTVLDERRRWLDGLLATLDEADSEAAERVLTTLLRGLYDSGRNSTLLCRYCDRDACTAESVCPVGQAERELGDTPP
ncbi:MAG: MarR family transcriptional regulator [Aldersonia sp.]|nr:MarR family transcriptional regulator [Aldersonia sp.]